MPNTPLRTTIEAVSCSPSPGAVIAAVGAGEGVAVLDSAAPLPQAGRYTIIACQPLATYSHRPDDGNPFERMRRLLACTGMLAPAEPPSELPFAGGWIGYFSYEAGRYLERLPATVREDVGLPLARFALYDSAAIHDRQTGRWTIVAVDPAGWDLPSTMAAHPGVAERIRWWKQTLGRADAGPSRPHPAQPLPGASVRHNLRLEEYLSIVDRGREYIAAGDIFQVNLARRESTPAREDPLSVYLRLRESNAGAYSAFVRWSEAGEAGSPSAEAAILSSSPELLLHLENRNVATRPIKGTRPRSSDPAVDESLRLELAASEKDRAELAMIVDLERNDLGRVCEFGSIRVAAEASEAAPFALESHPTVHHLVATVSGRLAEGRDAIDLLRATFPGGSITGAPKVRAMEIIDELEPTERSVYTGSIGYFTPGRLVMNIAIRTMIQAGGMLHWYAGGGIVADSRPEAEFEETCAKALGMRRALGLTETADALKKKH